MADPMLKIMHDKCGPGGLHCCCCNRTKNDKALLRRWARRKLKESDKKELEE